MGCFNRRVREQGLLLTGTVGAGKTTVAEEVGALLAARGVPHAVIDLDALRRVWPAPPGDPFNTALELANLRAVAANARAAGARVLVLAGVVEDVAGLEAHAEAAGLPLAVVRLRVAPEEAERRLRERHRADPEGLAWHLHRRGELEAVLDAAGLPGTTVDTTGLTPEEVAERALAAAG